MNIFYSLKNQALDLLFPKRCVGCAKEGLFLCFECTKNVRFIPPACFVCGTWRPKTSKILPGRTCKPCRKKTSIYGFLSPFAYENGIPKTLIHALKYERVREMDDTIAALLARYLKHYRITFSSETLLVPIPLHAARERTRGFNQSKVIAQKLVEKLKTDFTIPPELHNNILFRVKKTAPQIELSGEMRQNNMTHAFGILPNADIANKTVLLLDDVKTTGATLNEAACILKNAGTKKIWAIAVAH